jgi:DNA primase
LREGNFVTRLRQKKIFVTCHLSLAQDKKKGQTMIDTQTLKARHDLRRIVEQDLGPAPRRGGQALLWKCPFHHEQQGYSLVVWSNGYRCFGACQVSGDVFDWLQRYRNLDFLEAVRVLDGEMSVAPGMTIHHPEPPDDDPPPLDWQTKARQVVDRAEETLWSLRGEQTLDYLTQRGLDAATIQAAHLGLVPGGYRQWIQAAGLNVPCGIVIPWLTGGDEVLWAVKVRREAGFPKYVQIAGGSSGGLYQADVLKGAKAVLFCEGEFDTLLAHQEAQDLVSAVTLGSAANRLSRRWLADLVSVPLILLAYDMDEAGEKGAARLRSLSRRMHPVRVPWGKDLTEFHQQGGDLHPWLARELRQACQNSI